METLQWSSRSPIGVIVIAIFVTLLGLLSLWRLPLQLFPDIERPELSIQTNWRAASPEEVESELLEPPRTCCRDCRAWRRSRATPSSAVPASTCVSPSAPT